MMRPAAARPAARPPGSPPVAAPLLGLSLLLLGLLRPSSCVTRTLQGEDFFARTRSNASLLWDPKEPWTRVHVGHVGQHSEPVSSKLAGVLGYKFTLPPVQLRRGTVYTGAATRLRRLVSSLMVPSAHKGREFKIAVVGGSISWGAHVNPRGEADWFSIFGAWLITTFPRANIKARNGCTPGVPTPYMIMCLELSVDPDVDLVFVEYTINDGYDADNRLLNNQVVKDAERLVRRILALPNHPAVVLMQVPMHGIACYPKDHPKFDHFGAYRHFHDTTEDAQASVAQYYDVQYLSLRTAVYRLAARETPGFMWEQLFVDHHPGNHGHKVMADLAVNLLQRVALGLLMEPFDGQDREVLGEPLPPPMYPGNLPPSSPMCRVGEELRSLVVLSEGFEYLNEGSAVKPKPGFVATRPGARLQLRLDTDRSAVGCTAEEKVHIYLHHLRSYEHMGSATLSCVSGCACTEVVVDAHITDRVSQVYMAELVASQARECVVQVQVMLNTTSAEHKFKVSGVVVAERAGKKNVMNSMGGHNQAFGLQEHTGDAQMAVQGTAITAAQAAASVSG